MTSSHRIFSVIVVIAAFDITQHFVDSKPAPNLHQETSNDRAKAAVIELDRLRHLKGKSVEHIEKSQIQIKDGHKTEIKDQHHTVKDAGGNVIKELDQKTVNNIENDGKDRSITKTHVNVPSQNIDVTYVQQSPDSDATVDKKSLGRNGGGRGLDDSTAVRRQRIEFNPIELAKYIDETGDEQGIVLAINELLDDGLLTREQAMEYLERIKMALQMMRESEEHHGNALNELRQPHKVVDDDDMLSSMPDISSALADSRRNAFDGPASMEYVPTDEEQQLLNKLQVADYLYTQYELQVIYQLFKDMFRNKLAHGSPKDVQLAVERFATFLDNERQFGRISDQLQSEITETMTSAMVSSLAETNKLASFNPNQDRSNNIKRSSSDVHGETKDNKPSEEKDRNKSKSGKIKSKTDVKAM